MLNKIYRKLIRIWYLYIRKDRITYARKLGVRMGERCQLLCDPLFAFGTEPWLIRLGNHVDVTAGVEFLNHEGGIWCARGIDSKYEPLDKFLPIVVGDNVMIGVHSLIMPGVTIGNNVIIGGHSVVTKDVPDGTIVAGIPAQPISTVEKFMARLDQDCVPTKHMTQEQKHTYLKKIHPEWFE